MYPNPQDALPLPARPDPEQYRKRAKDLVKACRAGDPDAIRQWSTRWIETLAAARDESDWRRQREAVAAHITRLTEFARKTLTSAGESRRCRLADAQFVIARAHGFPSWPTLTAHLASLAQAASRVSAFEAAADAIVAGDEATLERLLREHPDLVRARSSREHHATLLHYVSANGVEDYRQRSPKNAAAIAALLLDAGAEVDPEADVYGGGCTPLGLVATSSPPRIAGVQRDVIDVLLAHGARMDHPGSTGNGSALVRGCLMNGCPEAARYLAERGAPLDFTGAAGVGRLDVVRQFVGEDGAHLQGLTESALLEGFAVACGMGGVEIVAYLLDGGLGVDRELRLHGNGHTGLHVASYHGEAQVARLLLGRGADVHRRDLTWHTPPLVWALTGWAHALTARRDREPYYDVAALLVEDGADVTPELLDDEDVRADPRMRRLLGPG